MLSDQTQLECCVDPGQVYLQTRGSEGALVALVRFLGGPELCSISVGDLFPTENVILDCSFERGTEDTHRAHCHGGPGRQTTVSNSIKGNIQISAVCASAVCAFRPRQGNLREHTFSCFPVSDTGEKTRWDSYTLEIVYMKELILCSLLIANQGQGGFNTNSRFQHWLVKSKYTATCSYTWLEMFMLARVVFNVPQTISHPPQYLRSLQLYSLQHKFEGNVGPMGRTTAV